MTPTDIEQLPYRKNAGVVLRNRNGLIFAGQRIDNNQDAWQMPQGGIDDGEDSLDAAYRELEEETGVSKNLVKLAKETQDWLTYDLPIDLVPKLWKGRYRGQAQKWYLMDFLGVDSDVNIALPKPEFSKWVWMPSDKLVEKIVPFKREIYTAVFEEFDLI